MTPIDLAAGHTAGAATHPCFHPRAAGRYGRIHLPVAPDCNIHCRYCNRIFDCTHECRPGVTSKILAPEEALDHLASVLDHMPWITVAGIAGPGDAFADPERTLMTIELIRRKYPSLHICLSTNGLALAEHIPTLAELRVGFVTITTNAVDPIIGARMYAGIRHQGKSIHGPAAAEVLIDHQLGAMTQLKARNITVKVNTVVIPEINDDHVPVIAREIAQRKVDLHNLIALIPVPGTTLAGCRPPSPGLMASLRQVAGEYIRQMHHCTRCRADAAGLLAKAGNDA